MPPETQPPMDQSPDKMKEYFDRKYPKPEKRPEAPKTPEKNGPDFLAVMKSLDGIGSKLEGLFTQEKLAPEDASEALRDFPEDEVVDVLRTMRELNASGAWKDSVPPRGIYKQLERLSKALEPSEHPIVQDVHKADALKKEVDAAIKNFA